MSQIIISYIDRRPLPIIFIQISPKMVKVGSYFVIWLTLWHNGTQVMLNQAWTTLDCLLVFLPTQIGLFDPLFWRKNKNTVFWFVQGYLKTRKLLWWKIVLRRGRKQYQSILNINHSEVKVKIKYVFTFYFLSFWAVQRELQHIEFLHFWYIFCEFPAWKTEVRKLASQYLQFWICLNMS